MNNNIILSEAVLNLDDDVDYIFKNGGFESFFKNFDKGLKPFKELILSNRSIILFNTIHSNRLSSEEAVAANKINPVDIDCGFSNMGSYYDPINKQIFISLDPHAFETFYTDDDRELYIDSIKSFRNEFKPTRIKSTIYHELSHWIRDSLHGKHIEKIISKAKLTPHTDKKTKIKNLGLPDTYMTNYEIDALVHSVKQFRKDIPKEEWDSMSFKDLIDEIRSFKIIYNRIKDKSYDKQDYDIEDSKKWHKQWIKLIVKRLDKEGLLGKNMKYFERKDVYGFKF